jgi:hypothetical protein
MSTAHIMITASRSANIYQRTSTPLLIEHQHKHKHSVLVITKQLNTILLNIFILIPAMFVGSLAGLLLTSVLLGVTLYEGIGLGYKISSRRK